MDKMQRDIFPPIEINKGDLEFVKGPRHPDRKRTELPKLTKEV